MEYALNFSPDGSTQDAPVPASIIEDNSTDYITLSYLKLREADGVTYSVEWSDDLITWSGSGVTILTAGDGSAVETVAGVPVDSAKFLRLKVEL